MPRKRTLLLAGTGLALAAAGGYAALNRPALEARYAGYRLTTAATDADRATAAGTLLALGDPAAGRVVDILRGGDEPACRAVAAAAGMYFAATPPGDPAFAAAGLRLLQPQDGYSPAGRAAVLELVPDMLKSTDAAVTDGCRAAVRAGFAAESPEAKIRAVKLALRPGIDLQAEVVPLMSDPAASVRLAAIVTVGQPTAGGDVISDEALFPWLNDPDAGVRGVCESTLKARGRSADEVALGRRLTHPDPAERLKLLLDLRWPDDGIKDVGPWLDRLSADPDPAVRAGVARVTVEAGVRYPAWLARLAADPDGSVRRVAAYYRGLQPDVQPAGFNGR